MSEGSDTSVQQLFKKWRNGDAEAGQSMAQHFSDWYYAISAARLGDLQGRGPLETACASFAQGIVTVARAGDLVDWAHELLQKEVVAAGGRVAGGDFPNALTRNQSPTALLKQAATGIAPQQARLLALAFDPNTDAATLGAEAENQGGMPLAVLSARYALKQWLAANAGVTFAVLPDSPNLDLAPLPLYECARMADDAEETAFEKWLISDVNLCKDVAEFATFAHALRSGAFSHALKAPEEKPRPVAEGSARVRPEPKAPVADHSDRKGLPMLAIAAAVGAILFVLVAIIVVILFVLN